MLLYFHPYKRLVLKKDIDGILCLAICALNVVLSSLLTLSPKFGHLLRRLYCLPMQLFASAQFPIPMPSIVTPKKCLKLRGVAPQNYWYTLKKSATLSKKSWFDHQETCQFLDLCLKGIPKVIGAR